MIINNRIQLFLYQNVIPTGLNYESGMLLSTVYFKGAEYPHIDIFNLPNYVGKSRDSLTKNMSDINSDSISTECREKFNRNYCGFEKNLESIQYSIDKANENWIDNIINCLLTWARTYGALLGINLLSEAYEYILESGVESGITATTLPAALITRIKDLKQRLQEQYAANLAFNRPIEERIEYLLDSIEEVTGQLTGRNGLPPNAQTRRALAKYREGLIIELREKRASLRPQDYVTAELEREVQEVQNLIKQHLKSGKSGVSGVLNKAKEFISIFFSKIKALLVTLAAGLGRAVPWLALSLLIYANTKLYQCFTAACEKRLKTVRDLEQVNRGEAAKLYYETMEKILKSGCCDKGSGSGSEGCNIPGVGLTLLMGNKYIPTYYDNINQNYMNTNVEATPGANGWKPNCPPQSGSIGGPDCLTCGLTRTPDANKWEICTDKPITSSTSLEIKIPNHTCACGWKKEPSLDPCNLGDIFVAALDGILSSVRSITGIIDGVIGTGGAIGQR